MGLIKVYPKIGDAGEPYREVWHPSDWNVITLPANSVEYTYYSR